MYYHKKKTRLQSIFLSDDCARAKKHSMSWYKMKRLRQNKKKSKKGGNIKKVKKKRISSFSLCCARMMIERNMMPMRYVYVYVVQ